MKKNNSTPSLTSPKNNRRACLCKDKNTYSRECCDGSLWSQGIGSITRVIPASYLQQENGDLILQENKYNIKI